MTKTRDVTTAPKTHRASRPAQVLGRRRALPQRGPATSATTQVDAKELAVIVSTVAAASARLAKATRSKDVASVRTAMLAVATAERRGGELLVKLGGRLKPLPIGHTDRKRWRQAAVRSAKAFAAKLQRDVAKTLARIDAMPSRPPAPTRSPAKRPHAAPSPPRTAPSPPRTTVSAWRQDADGGLVRTVGAVDADKTAAAHAGAA